MSSYDHIVVGAGTAGCVVAAGLAERGARVLLLEAGPEQPSDPRHRLHSSASLVLEGHNWPHRVNLRSSERFTELIAGRSPSALPPRATWSHFPYAVGKVVGGSSAVNGTIAQRGLPGDFDAWRAAGNPMWGWGQVEPCFRSVEQRLHLTRTMEFHVLDQALKEACQLRGLPFADLNDPVEAVVGPIPSSSRDGLRRDLATTHLNSVRHLVHLRVDAHVDRVKIEGGRARGVTWLQAGALHAARADHVVLCAGALATPALLQRSGVGNPAHLTAVGIEPRLELPGVGEKLADHAMVVLWALPRPGVVSPRPRWRELAARLSSGVDDEVDVQIGLLNNVDASAIPGLRGRLGDGDLALGLSIMLMRPRSTGRVFVGSPDPTTLPLVDFALGSEADDVERLAAGVRLGHGLLTEPGLGDHIESVQFWTASMMHRPQTLISGVRNLIAPGWHACGTARMGAADDPFAVVDERCAVHGVDGLSVVDASVFPSIPSTPTNLTTAMLADRVTREVLG